MGKEYSFAFVRAITQRNKRRSWRKSRPVGSGPSWTISRTT